MHNTIYKIGLVSENPTLTAEFYKDQFSYSEVITPNISKGSILLSGLAGPFLHIYPSEITELECGLHHIFHCELEIIGEIMKITCLNI